MCPLYIAVMYEINISTSFAARCKKHDQNIRPRTNSEYLFDLFAARAAIYGLESVDEMLAYGPRLSLKTQGFLGRPSAPMLVVNGEKDSQVPISDLYMLMQSGGSAKWSWVNPDGGHTGRSQEWPNSRIAEEVIAPWIKARLEPAPENKQARNAE